MKDPNDWWKEEQVGSYYEAWQCACMEVQALEKENAELVKGALECKTHFYQVMQEKIELKARYKQSVSQIEGLLAANRDFKAELQNEIKERHLANKECEALEMENRRLREENQVLDDKINGGLGKEIQEMGRLLVRFKDQRDSYLKLLDEAMQWIDPDLRSLQSCDDLFKKVQAIQAPQGDERSES